MGGKGGERSDSFSARTAAEVTPEIIGNQPLFLSRKDRIKTIRKRDRREVTFDKSKISDAIFKAAQAVGGEDRELAENLAESVTVFLNERYPSPVPTVEDIQDMVEKVLVETGHAKTALAYARYRDKRSRIRKLKQGDADEILDELTAAQRETAETTDISLFVRTSEEDLKGWDRQRIVDALVKETGLQEEIAKVISLLVEQQIVAAKLEVVTAPLVRELVDAKLVEYGLEEHRRKHTRLGAPLYDVDQIITIPNKENANIPHNPEATNLMLAERVKKEYALLRVFSQNVADAHIKGDIHLHDLGFIDRPYCSGQSVEYVKKFGLDLPNALSIAKPARHPETLLAHMVKFSAALQGHFAGAIGWDAVNIFFAPFLEDLDDYEIHQMAQMLIFEYSQQAVARGGQAIFSDINLYWEIPKHFEDVEAVGPGGEYTGRTYTDYIETSQRFVWALFDVYKEGDGCGRPFFFPKPLVHITEKFFETPGHEEFLKHISDVAADKGNTYFVFDRGQTAKISECCRLSFKLEQSDLEDARHPWRMRYSALQNVSLNLPRAAYIADGDDAKLFQRLDELLEIAVEAHKQKKTFVERLLAKGSSGPLSLLTMERDGQAYLRMHRVTYLIGLLGLNELVQAHTGNQLHETEEAFELGLKVVAYLNLACKRLSRREHMHFVLEQTPAESTCYRLAKLDLEHHNGRAADVVKGTDNQVYYTNSTQLSVAEVLSPIERVRKEGLFHDMIEAGALTHIWLADARPSADSVANLVKKIFYQSRNAQVAFSPEFTSCNSCSKVHRGLTKTCAYCGSEDIDGITRVTGYFSKTSGWNPGKIGELQARARWKDTANPAAPRSYDQTEGGNGKEIEIFGLTASESHPNGCARCTQAKKVIGSRMGLEYRFWDIETTEGLARLASLDLSGLAEQGLPVIRVDGHSFSALGKAVRFIKSIETEAAAQ